LLTDGTPAAARFVAPQNSAEKHARPGHIVHAAVLKKAGIFGGYEGLAYMCGEVFVAYNGAVLFEITAQQDAVGRVNIRSDLRLNAFEFFSRRYGEGNGKIDYPKQRQHGKAQQEKPFGPTGGAGPPGAELMPGLEERCCK